MKLIYKDEQGFYIKLRLGFKWWIVIGKWK